ncbi:hypothetical protein KSP39_PZI016136 [Platanthera zijinensis]|uniref:Ribosomal protein L23 n=1 Tax=Platanthera zijinensis TaxID=2320716 RepID=A0AAP0B7U7_9ASPA
MDGIKYAVFTEKSIRFLGNNQYTSNVESGSTRTEIKHWIELFFGVKVIAMNSHRLSGVSYFHVIHRVQQAIDISRSKV